MLRAMWCCGGCGGGGFVMRGLVRGEKGCVLCVSFCACEVEVVNWCSVKDILCKVTYMIFPLLGHTTQ